MYPFGRSRRFQEMLALFDGSGCFPLGDGLHLVGLSLDALCGDGETTEVNPRNGEEAFGLLGVKFFLAEFGEHLLQVLLVVGLGFGVDDDVVDVDLTERAVLGEDEVHGPLEGRPSVAQYKRHDSELVTTVSGLKGGAFSVFRNNQNLVETRPESILVKMLEPAILSIHSSILDIG